MSVSSSTSLSIPLAWPCCAVLLQVEKAVKTRRAKLVLLAPNIASIEEQEQPAAAQEEGEDAEEAHAAAALAAPAGAAAAGGPSEAAAAEGSGSAVGSTSAESPAAALVALSREKEVPLVFALSRQRMGKVRALEYCLCACGCRVLLLFALSRQRMGKVSGQPSAVHLIVIGAAGVCAQPGALGKGPCCVRRLSGR